MLAAIDAARAMHRIDAAAIDALAVAEAKSRGAGDPGGGGQAGARSVARRSAGRSCSKAARRALCRARRAPSQRPARRRPRRRPRLRRPAPARRLLGPRLAVGPVTCALASDGDCAMTVHFIGAGPGAADLITVRGRDLIARCPVCLYAGSIVAQELLDWCPPGARLVDTAPLSLDEIEREYVAAHEAGQDVARLHSGDLSVWSAVAEQVRRLEKHGIPYTLTPGVPAFAAAAASLGPRTDHPGSRAKPGADPRFGPRLANAAARDARRFRRDRRDAGHPSRHPRDRPDRCGTVAALWQQTARSRSSSTPRGRTSASLRGTLATIEAEAGRRPDRAHRDHLRRTVARRRRISAKARSTTPPISGAFAAATGS